MLNRITPVILTFNEERNIGRTLSALGWAQRIVVVDSGSTDATLSILAEDPRVSVFSRQFDSHGQQWAFAINDTNISSDWVLRLDADYLITPALKNELASLAPPHDINGYQVGFDYAVCGQPLRASLYPPKPILFRNGRASTRDQGHTEVWQIDGPTRELKNHVLHDDRKVVTDWLRAQGRYVGREYALLQMEQSRTWTQSLRLCPPLMPFVTFLYCLFVKGLILDGRAGLFYSLQRLLVEIALSLTVLEARLDPPSGRRTPSASDSKPV